MEKQTYDEISQRYNTRLMKCDSYQKVESLIFGFLVNQVFDEVLKRNIVFTSFNKIIENIGVKDFIKVLNILHERFHLAIRDDFENKNSYRYYSYLSKLDEIPLFTKNFTKDEKKMIFNHYYRTLSPFRYNFIKISHHISDFNKLYNLLDFKLRYKLFPYFYILPDIKLSSAIKSLILALLTFNNTPNEITFDILVRFYDNHFSQIRNFTPDIIRLQSIFYYVITECKNIDDKLRLDLISKLHKKAITIEFVDAYFRKSTTKK